METLCFGFRGGCHCFGGRYHSKQLFFKKERKRQESAIKSGTKKSFFNKANPIEENKPEPTPKLEEKTKRTRQARKRSDQRKILTPFILSLKKIFGWK